MDIPEHPDIEATLQTGYPARTKELPSVRCSNCDIELSSDDPVIDYDGDALCGNCFINRLTEDMSAEDIAKRLGFIVKDADTYAEEMKEEMEEENV